LLYSKIKNYTIFKFGFILTKMSESHKSPIFSISKEKAAKLIIKNLYKKGKKIYPTFPIYLISIIFKFLLENIINLLEEIIN
jgi:hypothetical protein